MRPGNRKVLRVSASRKSGRPVIGICINGDNPYMHGVHAGIVRFVQEKPCNWDLVLCLPEAKLTVMGELRRHFDGMISAYTEIDAAETLRKRLPTVLVGYRGDDRFRYVLPNHRANGELAARHLMERSLVQFGSFMNADPRHVTLAWMHEGFEEAVRSAGHDVERFHNGTRARRPWTLPDQIRDLEEWLSSLAKPVGVFASDDDHAWRVIEAANRAGIKVPEEVSVVGSMNAEWICEFSRPRITSVSYNQVGVGYEAARALHRILQTGKLEKGITFAPVGRVVARESSLAFAVDDPVVNRALQSIWTKHEHGYRLSGLLEDLPVSRSVLFQRFRAANRPPPAEELRLARVERAKQLLVTTRKPLAEIADECGFDHLSQLSREIRAQTGLPPSEFRLQREI